MKLNLHSKIFFILIAIVLLLSFYLFSYAVNQGFMKQFDFDTTIKIQEKIDNSSRLRLSKVIGELMEGSTFLASPEISVVAILLLTGFAFYDWRLKKIRFSVLLIPILFFLLVVGEVYGKRAVHHPAPPFFLIKNPTTIFPKYYINDEYSYPSGHAARAIYIGFSIYLTASLNKLFYDRGNLRWIIIALLMGYALLVTISRIYLGHHWFSDIVGGLLLGSGLGICQLLLITPKQSQNGNVA